MLKIIQEIIEMVAFAIATMVFSDKLLSRFNNPMGWAIFCLLTISCLYKLYKGSKNMDGLMETMLEELGEEDQA